MQPRSSGSVAGILLAGGASVRMGQNKLLLTFEGETIVRRAARLAVAALDHVVVVLGYDAPLVRAELAGLSCAITVNQDHGLGMHTSVQAGLAAVPAHAAAAVVLLADMPLVTSEMIRALVERFRATGAELVLSQYGDAMAPPHLYSRSRFAELAERGSGKQVIGRHRAEAEILRWPASALTDLDVPADRERLEPPSRPS